MACERESHRAIQDQFSHDAALASSPISFQYGINLFSHCQVNISPYSAGQGTTGQFGCFASSLSPAVPEKALTTGTPRRDASLIVFRKTVSDSSAKALSGVSGLP